MANAVWITGANSGIGRAVALYFARKGETVIASARREEELKKLLKEENVSEENLIIVPLDVTDPSQITHAFNNLKENYQISTLINNAGISSFQPALVDKTEEIKKIVDTNLLGSINMIRTVLPDMIERRNGKIISIISVVTKKIFKNSSAYSASKAGLEAYLNVLREEIREHNIRVMNIYPGATKTPIWPNKALEKFATLMMKPDKIAEIIYDAYMLQDNVVPEEIMLRPVSGDL